jgi:hypothetical protein
MRRAISAAISFPNWHYYFGHFCTTKTKSLNVPPFALLSRDVSGAPGAEIEPPSLTWQVSLGVIDESFAAHVFVGQIANQPRF